MTMEEREGALVITRLPIEQMGLLALGLAILDFIPIIGSGTVMVPWAVVALFTRDFSTAVYLMVIWGVVAMFRRVAEPRFVGDQTGLSPILSLISMYVGMKLAGVLGMILGPILCLVALNICRTGLFDGLAADLGAGVCLLGCSLLGLPVSTTHTKTSAIMGVGAVKRLSAINFGVVKDMMLTWVFTFPGCGLISFVMAKIFTAIF